MSRSSPRRSGGAAIHIAHLLMCIAMAGMLVGIETLPSHAWEAIFGLLTAWFAWGLVGETKVDGVRSLVSGDRAAHLFHCAAMTYMFAALRAPDGMGMAGIFNSTARSLEYPALALAFAFVLGYYSVQHLSGELSSCRRYVVPSDAAAPGGDTAPTGEATVATALVSAPPYALQLSAATAVACRAAMGVTMVFMLLTMS